jgi:hypothetical protein
MILVKFLLILLGIYLTFFILVRVFGKAIARYLLRAVQRRAQREMDRQSREYQQHAQGHNPYEENVFVNDDLKVTYKRDAKGKAKKDHTFDPNRIEQVEYEDLE